MTFRHLVLERLKVTKTQAVARSVLDTVDVRFVAEDFAHAAVFAIDAYVLAERLPPETVRVHRTFRFNVPASGWQQWKADHGANLPGWFLRRWPVRFREHVHDGELTVNLQPFWTFPESTVAVPELGRPLRYIEWDQSEEWTERRG